NDDRPYRLPTWQQLANRLPARQPAATSQELEAFEIALQRNLRPVFPPQQFRDGLRHNLAVAGQRRYAGLQVEAQRSYSQGILVGTSIGIFTLLVSALLYLLFKPKRLGS
ncbi:MAG: hypothetical protein ACYC6L_05800, partial [Anaerolineae bacterium]